MGGRAPAGLYEDVHGPAGHACAPGPHARQGAEQDSASEQHATQPGDRAYRPKMRGRGPRGTLTAAVFFGSEVAHGLREGPLGISAGR
jgi:hypothetical protein